MVKNVQAGKLVGGGKERVHEGDPEPSQRVCFFDLRDVVREIEQNCETEENQLGIVSEAGMDGLDGF